MNKANKPREKSEDKVALTGSQKDELDKRYQDHQNGIGQSFTWDETLATALSRRTRPKSNLPD